MPSLEEYLAEIAPLWASRMLTNGGKKHEAFELALRQGTESYDCVLFANGHLALEGALLALGLSGEVITTPFTFASTTHAIVRAGLTPIMCDISATDATLDPACIEPLVSERTCAILPVHVYGNLCDVEAIQKIADRHGLKVVYDAAHAFGERLDGTPVMSYGDASMLSFHATKVFNSVEGGAVCIPRDCGVGERLRLLRNFGIADYEVVDSVGFNAKMSEFHAAMGLCNLRHVEEDIERRRLAYERYRERLERVAGIRLISGPAVSRATSNYAYLAMIVENGFGMSRDDLHEALARWGIRARKYFYPCTNAYACYRGVLDPSATPVAQTLSRRVLCLPLFSTMTAEQVDYVCDAVVDAAKDKGRPQTSGGTIDEGSFL
jgi:dTDP-4-amino-4,6-dideoxygalactose transaminase